MKERWKKIPGWPYEISDIGRVRRLAVSPSNGFGKTIREGKGFPYSQISLSKDGVTKILYVHRLVCAAFHGAPISDDLEVAHGDCDKQNNNATNLRWATHKSNFADSVRLGGLACGERNGTAKLTIKEVKKIRSMRGFTQKDLAQEFGVSQGQIHRIRTGKQWISTESFMILK